MFKTLVMFILFDGSLFNAEPIINNQLNVKNGKQLTVRDNFKVIRRSDNMKLTDPFICGPNEVFSDCVTPCQATCERQNESPCPQFNRRIFFMNQLHITVNGLIPPKYSIYTQPTTTSVSVTTPPSTTRPTAPQFPKCRIGCICTTGFVRNQFGRCIPRYECPPVCKLHSHFEKCGPKCQPTCEFAEPRGISICAQADNTCVSGCFCDVGYVKDMKTGECVRPDQCSQNCPEDEHYSDYGVACTPSCQTRVVDIHKCSANHTEAHPGCYCNTGFIRDLTTKRCVREHDCPVKEIPSEKCPENEEMFDGLHKCKPDCIPTCAQPLKCSESEELADHNCETGRDCKKAFGNRRTVNV